LLLPRTAERAAGEAVASTGADLGRFGAAVLPRSRVMANVAAIGSRPRQETAMETTNSPAAPLPQTAESTDVAAARRYVKRLRDFYLLLATAVIVVAIAAAVNLAAGGRLWFPWVIFGFAIAIGFAAFDTFGRHRLLGRDWQERKLREVLERQRSR
jgi:hypothetical protein